MGTLTFHRGRCAAATWTVPTSCGSTSTRSPGRRSPTRCGWPAPRASCWRNSGCVATRRPRATAASTSSCGSTTLEFLDVRHTAIGFGRELARRDSASRSTGGRRSGASGSSSTSTRTPRPHHRLGVLLSADPRRAGSRPADVEELAEVTDPREFNVHRPRATGGLGDAWASIDERRTPSSRCSRSTRTPAARCRSRRTTRRCPASRRGAAQQEGRGALGRRRQLDRARVIAGR